MKDLYPECVMCEYLDNGRCMIGSWLDPFTRPKRDINDCLREADEEVIDL